MKPYILLALLFITNTLFSQTIIEGYVKSTFDKAPIDGVIVAVTDQNGSMVGYKMADNKGYFNISFLSSQKNLVLVVSLLGYETKRIYIENKSQKVNVLLNTNEIQLNEVDIFSELNQYNENTLQYNVDSLKSESDRTIVDIIKKLPDIEVNANGTIKYKGEVINRFYIEGSDLLENMYAIASKNIPVSEVKSIEIIQNHQPLKVLRNIIETNQSAINLKLKNEKMSRPVGNIKLGTGYGNDEMLWLFEAFALHTNEKTQNIVMYKTNNAGLDITSALSEHTVNLDNPYKRENPVSSSVLIDNSRFSSPPIEDKHYLFNKTHIITFNNLAKFSDNKQLRMNAHYSYDNREETIGQNSSYLLQDSTLRIYEENYLNKRKSYLDYIATYTDNSPSYYLNNSLKGVLKWDKTRSHIVEIQNVSQLYDIPEYKIQNELNFVKKWGKYAWEISSFISYNSLPQQLNISADTSDINYIKQDVHRIGLYSNSGTHLTYKQGKSRLRVYFQTETLFDRLKSNAYNPFLTNHNINNLKADYIITTLRPEYTYRNGKLSLLLDLPIRYHWYKLKDNEYNTKNTYDYFYVNPYILLKYKLSTYFDTQASYGYSHNIGDIMDFAQSYIFTDYRYVKINSGILGKKNSENYLVGLNYNNPKINTLVNSSFYYTKAENNFMRQQNFYRSLYVVKNIPFQNTSRTMAANIYGEKSVSSINTTFSLSANYSRSRQEFSIFKSERDVENLLYPVKSYTWSIAPKINTKINKWLSFGYYGNITNNKQHVFEPGNEDKTSYYRISQTLNAIYSVNNNLQINLQGEYLYNDISDDVSSELFFANLKINYKIKQIDFTLDWNNIFNQKKYSYIDYDGLNIYTYSYKLRPSEILLTMAFSY